MVDVARIGNSIYQGVKTGIEESIQILSQTNPVTNLITDVWGFGYQGGPTEGGRVREIILYKGKIGGFRDYKEEGGDHPLEWVTDLEVQEGKFIHPGGYSIPRPLSGALYDGDFERWGSAARLTNNDYRDVEDKTRLVQEIMNDSLSWYVKRGGIRRKLKNPDSTINPDYEVVGIPRARSGLLEKFDPRGFDIGAALYFGLQGLVYKFFDDILYDPFVERPIRKINERLKKRGFPEVRMDAFIETQYVAVSEVLNALLDLPSGKDLYYEGVIP